MREPVTLRRTIPWNDYEAIQLGDFYLSYDSPDHRSITEATIFLPGGRAVDFTELCRIAREGNLKLRLPQKIRSTNLRYA